MQQSRVYTQLACRPFEWFESLTMNRITLGLTTNGRGALVTTNGRRYFTGIRFRLGGRNDECGAASAPPDRVVRGPHHERDSPGLTTNGRGALVTTNGRRYFTGIRFRLGDRNDECGAASAPPDRVVRGPHHERTPTYC